MILKDPKDIFLFQLTSMTLYTTGCTDEELLHIKQDVLYMTNDFVTAQGLNKFLKVRGLFICFPNSLPCR